MPRTPIVQHDFSRYSTLESEIIADLRAQVGALRTECRKLQGELDDANGRLQTFRDEAVNRIVKGRPAS